MASPRVLSTIARRAVAARRSAPTGCFNWVGRDHNQGAYQNKQLPDSPEALAVAVLWASLNKLPKAPQIAGFYETGGQEFGATVESGRNPGVLLRNLREALGSDIALRSLSRSIYGNATYPLNNSDLLRWYRFVQQNGGNVVFKLFDYLSNPSEMQPAIDAIKSFGGKIEFAIPHSPEESYQGFFKERFEFFAKLAKQYDASLSVKRMVAGMTPDEAKRVADIAFAAAIENDISAVTLHAHGDTAAACAEFLGMGWDYGVSNVSVDIVHEQPESDSPTFPCIKDVMEGLEKSGHGDKLTISDEQWRIIAEMEQISQQRDSDHKILFVGGAFATEDKVAMGMPDGGESYTVAALKQSGLREKYGVSEAALKSMFQACYIHFRERFGMPTSVTPGHKRIEMATILMMSNLLPHKAGVLKLLDQTTQVFDYVAFDSFLTSFDYAALFQGLDAATTDAFRNNKLPEELDPAALSFLCKTHMQYFLMSSKFDALTVDEKGVLIEHADDVAYVEHVLISLVKQGKLDEMVLSTKNTDCSASILLAAGERKYTESDAAPAHFDNYKQALSKFKSQGYRVDNIPETALIALCSSPQFALFVAHGLKRPVAKGLNQAQYDAELKKYYTQVMAKPGNVIVDALYNGSYPFGDHVCNDFAQELSKSNLTFS